MTTAPVDAVGVCLASWVERLAQSTPARIVIAYSGGLDSQVLLHGCAQQPAWRERLLALHVHHGLQRDAEAWTRHCLRSAQQYGVPCRILRVDATAPRGTSPEDAARQARYQALQTCLAPGDILLTAQHMDDQAETFLLQALRGAGVAGLAAMPAQKPLGAAWLVRPFLHLSRRELARYAERHGLVWVEDPSNRHTQLARNALRREIMPRLKTRWPAAAQTLARAAQHCAEAHALLDELAAEWFAPCQTAASHVIDLPPLRALSRNRQHWVLRHWLQRLGWRMLTTDLQTRLLDEVIDARDDAMPQLLYDHGKSFRRYRDQLYALQALPEVNPHDHWDWPSDAPVLILPGFGVLQAINTTDAGIARRIWQTSRKEIRWRQGGESLHVPGRVGRQRLKHLWQHANVPPWRRARWPLLYIAGQLACVPGHWIAAEFYCDRGDNVQITFTPDGY